MADDRVLELEGVHNFRDYGDYAVAGRWQGRWRVHPDELMADYPLPNTAGDVEAQIAAGMETIRATSGQVDEAIMRIMMRIEPEWFEAVHARAREPHGGIEGNLRDVPGVDEALRERLRAALVEG